MTTTHVLLRALLHAGGCLGGILILFWLGRAGFAFDMVLLWALVAFLAIVGLLLVVQHPQAIGDAADWTLCWAETRTRGAARGWQSYRLAYNAEICTPMKPLQLKPIKPDPVSTDVSE